MRIDPRYAEVADLLADEERPPLPETRPDTEAYEHGTFCRCVVCKRPEALRWKRLAARHARP